MAALVAARLAVAAIRQRRWPSVTVLSATVVGGALVGARVVGLAYIDLTTFPALSATYLASAYAVVVALLALVAAGAVGSRPT